jgi:alcohol dehydrogenase class IV
MTWRFRVANLENLDAMTDGAMLRPLLKIADAASPLSDATTTLMNVPELNYDFLAPRRIMFGWGRRREAGTAARALGQRAWLVIGSRQLAASGAIAELIDNLKDVGVEAFLLAEIHREPRVEDVDRAVAMLRAHGCRGDDLVLGIGGGSAIDLAKAVAALATNDAGASVKEYLEGVGSGLQIVHRPFPVLAMPTTGGTGSEATKNAVISSLDPPFKKSLRSDQMIPATVLVDPELAVSVPPNVTAHTGMDAITQCIESYISARAKPIPQALAVQGLQLALPAIAVAVQDGSNRPAREAMAQAALLSGMALANSGLGLAHGVAAALGVHCQTPHGLACAIMLPAALRVNRDASEQRLAELERATNPTAPVSDAAAADAFIDRVTNLCRSVGIPERLSDLGVRREQIPALVAGSRGSSMTGNPRQLSDAELSRLLEEMM